MKEDRPFKQLYEWYKPLVGLACVIGFVIWRVYKNELDFYVVLILVISFALSGLIPALAACAWCYLSKKTWSSRRLGWTWAIFWVLLLLGQLNKIAQSLH